MPNEITVITNGQARELLSIEQLTDKERADFEYLNWEEVSGEYRFFRYRGNVYDIGEFLPMPKSLLDELPKSWAGSDDDPRYNYYASDTWFSGVVISLGDDGDYVVPGRYYS